MGMKLAIIERLKEGGDRHYMPDNNFHSLYVKRHQNVRWAGLWKCTVHVLWGFGHHSPGSREIVQCRELLSIQDWPFLGPQFLLVSWGGQRRSRLSKGQGGIGVRKPSVPPK